MREAQAHPNELPENIARFGLTEQKDLLAVALACANKGSYTLLKHIGSFVLVRSEDRLAVALACAEGCPHDHSVAQRIKNFGLTEPEDRFRVALACCRSDQLINLAEHLPSLELTSHRFYEVASELVDMGVSPRELDVGQADLHHRLALAQRFASDSKQCIGLMRCIDKFKIESEAQRYALAKTCLRTGQALSLAHLSNFAIADPRQRFQLIDQAISQGISSAYIMTYIEQFGRLNSQDALSVALHLAKKAPLEVAQNYSKFHIDDPVQKDQVVEACFRGDMDSRNLSVVLHFDLTKDKLLQYFHRSFGCGPTDQFFFYLKGVNVFNEAEMNQLLVRWVSRDPFGFMRAFKDGMPEIKGVNPHRAADLAIGCVADLPYLIKFNNPKFFPPAADPPLQALKHLTDYLHEVGISDGDGASAVQLLGTARARCFSDERFSALNETMGNLPVPFPAVEYHKAIFAMMAYIGNGDAEKNLRWAQDHQLFESILSLRSPDLAAPLGTFCARSLSHPGVIDQCTTPLLSSLQMKRTLVVPMRLVLARLRADGVDVAPLVGQINRGALKRSMRDAPQVRELLSSLMALSNTADLDTAAKSSVVKRLTDAPAIMGLGIFVTLGALAALGQDQEQSFDALLHNHLKAKLSGPGFPADALEKVSKTFQTMRQPHAIWRYMAALEQADDAELSSALRSFMVAVLDGNFSTKRYSETDSAHLQRLQQVSPGIIDAWRQPLSAPIAPEQRAFSTEFNAAAWLKLKLLEDRHLDGWVSREIRDHLDPQAQLPQPVEVQSERRVQANAIGKLCIALAEAKTPKEQRQQLGALQTLLQQQVPGAELLNDVNGQLASLQNGSARAVALQGVFTDSYRDLLLCGDEVPGSCQRTNGSHALNRGLLGYLLHGQTAMVAVTDPASGRIKSRAILRLLLADGTTPMLFLERPYGDSGFAPALEKIAIDKARSMGVSLASRDAKGAVCQHSLEALGGPAPYEYCDALEGLHANGQFAIGNTRYLFANESH